MNPLVTIILLINIFLYSPVGTAWGQDPYSKERLKMISAVKKDVLETSRHLNKKELDPPIISAMADVARHLFVPDPQKPYAYENRPLPIGYGQTISQPYIVAIMTDLLNPKPDHHVLEIGTGSGYQAAILSLLVKKVYSMEIIEPLANEAAKRLKKAGYTNVTTRKGDGYYGWQEHGPFDSIMVTAAVSHIPPPLLKQLKPQGRMVIPVGSKFMVQQLVLVKKDRMGNLSTRQVLPVMFVPLTGNH